MKAVHLFAFQAFVDGLLLRAPEVAAVEQFKNSPKSRRLPASGKSWGLIAQWPSVMTALCLGCTTIVSAQTLKTPGTYSIGQSGDASYSIPIFATPGPHGVQPNIALVYDSLSGYGNEGVGWSLAGLGAITRCNLTQAQDSIASAVTLTYTDRYCLNGNRLRLTPDSGYPGQYGQVGSTYETEVADYSVTTAYGPATGNGPSYFVQVTKNGWQYEYGNPANNSYAQVFGYIYGVGSSGTVLTWYLDKVTDPIGNTMTIAYNPPTTSYLYSTTEPALISWTPQSAGSSTYIDTMTFSYTQPTYVISGYNGGAFVQSADLLNSIQIAESGTVTKYYSLGYTTSTTTGRQTLSSVTECPSAPPPSTNCLPSTSFTYQSPTPGTPTTPSGTVSGVPTTLDVAHDFNGDGYPDLYKLGYVLFGSSSGYTGSWVSTGLTTNAVAVGDLTGAGRDGFLVESFGTWYYYTWNGSSFAGVTTNSAVPPNPQYGVNQYALVDINGDGLPDIVYWNFYTQVYGNYTVGYVAISVQINTGTLNSPSFAAPVQIGNFSSQYLRQVNVITNPAYQGVGWRHGIHITGDAREQLVIEEGLTTSPTCASNCPITSIQTNAVVYNGSSLTSTVLNTQSSTSLLPVFILDFNQDKCMDAVVGSQLMLSACNGLPGQTISLGLNVVAVMDWNDDGMVDLIEADGANLAVQLSTGNGVAPATLIGIPYNSSNTYLRLDANGDGLDDLGVISPSGSLSYYLNNGLGTPADLLASVTDGYGNFAKPQYVPINKSNYTLSTLPGSGSGYKGVIAPQYVVGQTTFSDPTSNSGATYYNSYTYASQWLSLTGRGLTPMNEVSTYDSRLGWWQTKWAELAFPQTGFQYQRTTQQNASGTTPVFVANITPTTNELDPTANNQRWQVYAGQELDSQYEAGTYKNGLLIKTTSTTNTVDSQGTVTASTVLVTDTDSTSPVSPQNGWTWKTVTNNVPDYGAAGCNNLLSAASVTYSETGPNPANPTITISKTLTPDTTGCRYATIVTQSGTPYQVTEQLGYDSFNNVNSDSVTGVNMGGSSPATRTVSAYWGSTGQFEWSLTDPTIETTKWTYTSPQALGFGVPDTVTDANGLELSYTYDLFGRKTKVTSTDSTGALGPTETWSYTLCSGCDPLPRMIIQDQPSDSQGNVLTTIVYWYDMLDRPLRTQTTAFAGGLVWSQYLTYDPLGRVVTSAFPYVQGSPVGGTTNAYDNLNRMTSTTQPISATNNNPKTSTMTYEGDTRISSDYLSNLTTTVMAADRKIHQVTDANGYSLFKGYDAAGSLTSVCGASASTCSGSTSHTLQSMTIAYGIAPFQTSVTDIDMGTWNATVDALGEVTGWTDAKSPPQSFSMTYDALSRPLTRTEPDYYTSWTYGNSASSHNIGQLTAVCTGSGGTCAAAALSESYWFDTFERLNERKITIPNVATYTYNWYYTPSTGLLSTLTYPTTTSSYALKLQYNYTNDFLQSISDISDTPNVTLWTANTITPAWRISQETLGNGVVINRTIDAVTQWPSYLEAGVGGGTGLLYQHYLFDVMGNVIQRQDKNQGLTETLCYDALNRLGHTTAGSTCSGTVTLQMAYDATGNITSRSDVAGGASWTYSPTHIHQVTQAGNSSFTYSYDNNGNAASRNGQTITWSSYNYPTSITAVDSTGTESVQFSYGPDRQRWEQNYDRGVELTYYVGGLMEDVVTSGGSDYRHYIYAGNEPVAVYSRKTSSANTWSYFLSDQQASVASIVNNSGVVDVNESFTPYGNRRSPTTWSGAPPQSDLTTSAGLSRQGYTFQTQLGLSMGLNHMNGRVQDAITGRFLSPDPYIPQPNVTQSYNRYSYVNNNPVSYIDPSGFDGSDPGPSGPSPGTCADPSQTFVGNGCIQCPPGQIGLPDGTCLQNIDITGQKPTLTCPPNCGPTITLISDPGPPSAGQGTQQGQGGSTGQTPGKSPKNPCKSGTKIGNAMLTLGQATSNVGTGFSATGGTMIVAGALGSATVVFAPEGVATMATGGVVAAFGGGTSLVGLGFQGVGSLINGLWGGGWQSAESAGIQVAAAAANWLVGKAFPQLPDVLGYANPIDNAANQMSDQVSGANRCP